MPTSLISTGVQFPDNSIQTTAATGGGGYAMNAYVSPTTWSKPAGLKAVKVTVVGAGGNGGAAPNIGRAGGGGGGGGGAIIYLAAPAIPGPVAVTAGGGTNSFGAFASGTAGALGSTNPAPGVLPAAGGAGGTGSVSPSVPALRAVVINGNRGGPALIMSNPTSYASGGAGSPSILGAGGTQSLTNGVLAGISGTGYGSGGSGGAAITPGSTTGGAGSPGIVIVEEFY